MYIQLTLSKHYMCHMSGVMRRDMLPIPFIYRIYLYISENYGQVYIYIYIYIMKTKAQSANMISSMSSVGCVQSQAASIPRECCISCRYTVYEGKKLTHLYTRKDCDSLCYIYVYVYIFKWSHKLSCLHGLIGKVACGTNQFIYTCMYVCNLLVTWLMLLPTASEWFRRILWHVAMNSLSSVRTIVPQLIVAVLSWNRLYDCQAT